VANAARRRSRASSGGTDRAWPVDCSMEDIANPPESNENRDRAMGEWSEWMTGAAEMGDIYCRGQPEFDDG